MLVRCALAALVMSGCLFGQDDDQDGAAVRGRALAILGEWRQGAHADHARLVTDLVALGKRASPTLCEVLEAGDASQPVEDLLQAIGQLGCPAAVPTVGSFALSASARVRLAAVRALADLGLPECLPHLVVAVDDEDDAVVRRAQAALLDPRVEVWRMVSALRDRLPAAKDKWRLTQVLARSEAKEAHEALLGLLVYDGSLQIASLQALRLRARSEDAAAVLDLLRRSSSSAVRKEACLFLATVKFRPATADLIDLLRQPEPGLVKHAHLALQQITDQPLKPDPELWEQWWSRSGKQQHAIAPR